MKGGKDVKTLDNEKIGSFIRELRREKNLTQRDLAERLHITDRAVSKWERDGKRRLVLNWLDTHNEWNLNPILNMGGEDTEYQFLQWGKDGESMLFYYAADDAGRKKEGYFWYNCRNGKISGELELPTVWEWGEKP